MKLNKMYHLFLTNYFFLSTEFTNVFFKRDFNSYTKCISHLFSYEYENMNICVFYSALFITLTSEQEYICK